MSTQTDVPKKNWVILLRGVEIQDGLGIFEKTKWDGQVLAERSGAKGDVTRTQRALVESGPTGSGPPGPPDMQQVSDCPSSALGLASS